MTFSTGPFWKTFSLKGGVYVVEIMGIVGIMAVFYGFFSDPLTHWIYHNESWLTRLIQPETFEKYPGWTLFPVAWFGGLISSLSPCILALLPANLSYIGTLHATSKREAALNASGFVMGVVAVLSAFGLISSFAGMIIVNFKGFVHIGIGLLTILFSFGLLGLIKITLPTVVTSLPAGSAPFIVGSLFALVTSPCASPVLFSLLLISGTSGQLWLSVGTMVSYAFGYTAIVFISSLLTGFLKHVSRLKKQGVFITRLASIFLLLTGIFYTLSGIVWFI